MSEYDIEIPEIQTSTLTTTFLLSVLSTKILTKPSQGYESINNSEIAILLIASIQYLITSGMKDIKKIQRLRYLDWILTTPLLLFTYWELARFEGWNGSYYNLLIPNILMIVFGYLAEFPEVICNRLSRNILYIISTIFLIIVLYEIFRITSFLKENNYNTQNIEYFFYIGWTLYGLNFLNPNENLRQTGFNILDLFNKGIYSLYLDSVIRNNLMNN